MSQNPNPEISFQGIQSDLEPNISQVEIRLKQSKVSENDQILQSHAEKHDDFSEKLKQNEQPFQSEKHDDNDDDDDDDDNSLHTKPVGRPFEQKLRLFIKFMVEEGPHCKDYPVIDIVHGPHNKFFSPQKPKSSPDRDLYRVANLCMACGLMIAAKGPRKYIWTGYLDTSHFLKSRTIIGLEDCAKLVLCVLDQYNKNQDRTFDYKTFRQSFMSLLEGQGIQTKTKGHTSKRQHYYCFQMFKLIKIIDIRGRGLNRTYEVKKNPRKKISFDDYIQFEGIKF